ncbi:MAG: hypothetical protein J7562_09635 [Agrobacterium tumefaciens]|nr:hypothetical protein [Agrobacterium tumefaciens]
MANDISPIGKRPYRVLCIDGGGMRGIYTAALLDKLSSYYAKLRDAEALDDQGRITGEELLYIRGSYVEDPNSSFEHCVILSATVSDVEPVMSIIRRTRELAHCQSIEVRCLVATPDALEAFGEDIIVHPMAVVSDLPTNYWRIEEALDQRPVRLVPRQSRWLVGRQFPEVRLDKKYGFRP